MALTPATDLRVALVHDWLTGMRGGEKVLELLVTRYPKADLFTLVHVPGTVAPAIERLRPRTAFVQQLPWIRPHYRRYLPLFPFAVEQFDLDEYDLVLSTSHCAVKSVITPGRACHLCYCHTPMRYVWDQYQAYFGAERIGAVASAALRPVAAWLARWDAETASRVDRYLANSQHVARRIRRYYNRSATVVHPPVDTGFYHPDGSAPEAYALVVSALVPYKRVELAIEACRVARLPLRIAGGGPERRRLEQMADSSVQFLGPVTNEELLQLYRRSRVFVLPGEEDFGIAPLEAQACGRPVVALARGGALETVVDQVTGVLYSEPTVDALADALTRAVAQTFDSDVIRRHALAFGPEHFIARFDACVEETLATPAESARW